MNSGSVKKNSNVSKKSWDSLTKCVIESTAWDWLKKKKKQGIEGWD